MGGEFPPLPHTSHNTFISYSILSHRVRVYGVCLARTAANVFRALSATHQIGVSRKRFYMADFCCPHPTIAMFVALQEENRQEYYELLVERVGETDPDVDLQIDHTFTLCKYIADDHQRACVALLKVMHARTGEYLGYFFVTSTSLDEGKLVESFKDRFKDRIEIVSADNAAGVLFIKYDMSTFPAPTSRPQTLSSQLSASLVSLLSALRS